MKTITSESKFVWTLIWHILKTPLTLIQVLLKRKEPKELWRPITDFVRFVLEPKFTVSIIAVTTITFVVSMFLSEQTFVSLINYPQDLVTLRLHTLITSGFLHGDIWHLLMNLLGIAIFGRVVERKLGALKTAGIYFGALVIAGIFESLIHLFITGSSNGTIGASGALMGLISAAILLDPFYLTYQLIIPIPILVLGWLAIYADITGVLSQTQDGIAHFAHIGGFISIALLMYFVGVEDRARLKRGLLVNILTLTVGIPVYLWLR